MLPPYVVRARRRPEAGLSRSGVVVATYTLEVVNSSSRRRTLHVLPEIVAEPPSGVLRLAWLTARVHRTTRLRITWDDMLEVAWAPKPGAREFPVRRQLAPGAAVELVEEGDASRDGGHRTFTARPRRVHRTAAARAPGSDFRRWLHLCRSPRRT